MSAPLRHNDADRASTDAPPWRRRAKPATPRDVGAPRFVGDRAMIELRRGLARNPQAVPEPPPALNARPSMDRLALRFCAVVAVAALATWCVVSFSRARLPGNEARQVHAVPAMAASKVKVMHMHTAAAAVGPALASAETPGQAQVALAVEAKAPAASDLPLWLQQPGVSIAIKTPELTPPPMSSSAAANKSAVDADEIAMLVKRGKAFMTDGDVVAARLLLQRAAEAGSADAALALGTSFDPLIIKQAGAIGVQTDAALARQWYQKAQALGSDTASKQLANLASAGQ